jgi:hypothetical protein
MLICFSLICRAHPVHYTSYTLQISRYASTVLVLQLLLTSILQIKMNQYDFHNLKIFLKSILIVPNVCLAYFEMNILCFKYDRQSVVSNRDAIKLSARASHSFEK